jgi:hypothetical protein
MLQHRRGLEPKTKSAERSTPQARNPRGYQSELRPDSRGALGATAKDGALTMSRIDKTPYSEAEAWKYAEKALTWYGWGSPVGLGILLVSLALVLLLVHQAGLL